MVLLILTKTPVGYVPTKFVSANVIPVAFHVAEGQNFGWLNDTAIIEIFSGYTVHEHLDLVSSFNDYSPAVLLIISRTINHIFMLFIDSISLLNLFDTNTVKKRSVCKCFKTNLNLSWSEKKVKWKSIYTFISKV